MQPPMTKCNLCNNNTSILFLPQEFKWQCWGFVSRRVCFQEVVIEGRSFKGDWRSCFQLTQASDDWFLCDLCTSEFIVVSPYHVAKKGSASDIPQLYDRWQKGSLKIGDPGQGGTASERQSFPGQRANL